MSRTGNKLVRVESVFLRKEGSGTGLSSPLKMPSEVATIRYLRGHTTIPIPEIYGYDNDEDHRVGGAWLVMEYVEGQNVDEIWHTLTRAQREQLALSFADVWSQLMQQTFVQIGSLYEPFKERFVVGPMTFLPSRNHYAIAPPERNRCGPFNTVKEWLEACARQDLAYRLSLTPQPEASSRIDTVLNLIRGANELQLCTNRDESRFSIEHVDYSTHNILVSTVDPTKIIAVLDWEGARIVPMWAMNPAFRWPHDSDDIENRHLRALMRDRIGSRVPGWSSAIGEECRPLRVLYMKATLSDRDPNLANTNGYHLAMSHDTSDT
ncbi:hypothetical protein EV361DRAFT_913803 [Lentinula raphanica]|uniref:Aminoglycoside phosphotransferase domain-containing protein n=1 Tax=Lentinula raphanica TaxID=153919 RepID=A0AA38UCP4_9AGAR|nr:hypothetical protein F5878DRAFT_622918 [Lentinula raphanica]KAJ3970909.1 hypothetical protein EV361DRAFT_913803 [Lentinula raphanica]